MSYEILYRARFIKTFKGLIPLIEQGSNNCYETSGSGFSAKRARDFYLWKNNLAFCTAEDILKSVNKIRENTIARNPDYKDDSFAYYTAIRLYGKYNTTWKDFLTYFTRAVKNAKTIEEWKEVGVYFKLKLTYKGYQDKDFNLPNYNVLSGENDIILNDMITLDSYGDVNNKVRSYKFERQEFSFLVQTPEGYLIRNTRYGYKYVRSTFGAKRYHSKSSAQKATKGRKGFVVEKSDTPTCIRKYK